MQVQRVQNNNYSNSSYYKGNGRPVFKAKTRGINFPTHKYWDLFIGTKIPSSLELNPIIFRYLKPDDNICDIGMGYGKTILELIKNGYRNLSGIDTNKSGVDFAKRTINELNLNGKFKFINANAENTGLPDKSQDAIITQAFWTTITNSLDRKNILNEIDRILKKFGILYISDFGQTPEILKYKHRYDLGIKKGYEKGTFEVINETSGKLEYLAHHYTKDEFTKLLEEKGFKIEEYIIAPVQTRSGNTINGHTIIARKV